MEVILIIGSAIVINVIVGVWLSKYRIAGKQVANPWEADCKHEPRCDWDGLRGSHNWFCDRCGKVLTTVERNGAWECSRRETAERIERMRKGMAAWEAERK